MKAAAYIVGPLDGPGAGLMEMAQRLDFAAVLPYAGILQAEHQANQTPVCFFLFAAVPDVASLRSVAEAIRFCPSRRVRFSPLIYFTRDPDLETIKSCIKMGFDDVIALPFASGDIADRIARQVGRIQTYYETSTYFGPDRRNRVGNSRSADSDHGGGQFRRIEIMRNPDTGIELLRDDFQVVV